MIRLLVAALTLTIARATAFTSCSDVNGDDTSNLRLVVTDFIPFISEFLLTLNDTSCDARAFELDGDILQRGAVDYNETLHTSCNGRDACIITVEISKCGVVCLDGEMLNVSALAEDLGPNITRLTATDNGLKALADNTFESMPHITDLHLGNNSLTSLGVNTFAPLSKLDSLDLYRNNLAILKNGMFDSQTNMRWLDVSENVLTYIESGTFDRVQSLKTLYLHDNAFTSFPRALQTMGACLEALNIARNKISEIKAGDFDGFSAMFTLWLASNPIVKIDTEAFLTLTRIRVSSSEFGFPSQGFYLIHERDFEFMVDSYLNSTQGALLALPPLVLNGCPRVCRTVGPLLTDITCDKCSLGYVPNSDDPSICVLPKFGPYSGWSYPNEFELPRTLYVRTSYNLPEPKLEPKIDLFVGYSDEDFTAIRYALEFYGDVDIGCDEYASSYTAADDGEIIQDMYWDSVRANVGFIDRPRHLRINVTHAGRFKFRACDSPYDNTLTLRRVYADGTTEIMSPNFVPSRDGDFLPYGWGGGCDLGLSSEHTVYLDAGDYVLTVRGHFLFDDLGGTYYVSMECYDGARSIPSNSSDPGGFSVDTRTGVVSGTPLQVGQNYDMRLVAFDRSNKRTELKRWEFDVVDPVFQVVDKGTDDQTSRNMVSKYYANVAHFLFSPNIENSRMFVNPAGNHFDKIVFLFNVIRIGQECSEGGIVNDLQMQFFSDAESGDMVMNISIPWDCIVNYTGVLKARDSAGFEAIIDVWNFTMYFQDVLVDENGPNSKGCENGGLRIDGTPFDDQFTCLCDLTSFTGDNCEEEDSFVRNVAVSLGTTLAVVIIAVGLLWGYKYWKAMRPHDFDDELAMLKERQQANSGAMILPKELSRSTITLLEVLGSGNFGEVRHGTYRAPGGGAKAEYSVAVKKLKGEPTQKEKQDFCSEALISAQFDHENIIGLIGVVTCGSPMLMVLQYCEHGALNMMLANRPKMAAHHLIGYLLGTAKGMRYLASQHFVHRDLAGRNILVDAADRPKIADFGLSRDLEEADYYQSDEKCQLPLRWCAPEVLQERRFTEASDAWAFGVVIDEVFNCGASPYFGWTNSVVLEHVLDGYVLPCNADCPEFVYRRCSLPCFAMDPRDRPKFEDLVTCLSEAADLTIVRLPSLQSRNESTSSRGRFFFSKSKQDSSEFDHDYEYESFAKRPTDFGYEAGTTNKWPLQITQVSSLDRPYGTPAHASDVVPVRVASGDEYISVTGIRDREAAPYARASRTGSNEIQSLQQVSPLPSENSDRPYGVPGIPPAVREDGTRGSHIHGNNLKVEIVLDESFI